MKTFRLDLWKSEEYTYEAAYGFMPNLHAYLHEEDDTPRRCMVIVPGGGYCMLAAHEGELPALEYYRMGLNVFVLTYTNDITMSVPLKKQPMNDLSRAVRLLRQNCGEYQIMSDSLLVCGFSAGGHVCGSLMTHYGEIEDPDPILGSNSNRPDAVILAYPVITTGEFTHRPSVQALLGQHPTQEELFYFSLEKQVKPDTPPCFLWQTLEDDLVPVENTYLLAEALRKMSVPHAHYVFPKGYHGLSVASEEMFAGWRGGEYVGEQLGLALEHVKNNTTVNLTAKRREELTQQFFAPAKAKPEEKADFALSSKPSHPQDNPFADVHTWLALSYAWFDRFLE